MPLAKLYYLSVLTACMWKAGREVICIALWNTSRTKSKKDALVLLCSWSRGHVAMTLPYIHFIDFKDCRHPGYSDFDQTYCSTYDACMYSNCWKQLWGRLHVQVNTLVSCDRGHLPIDVIQFAILISYIFICFGTMQCFLSSGCIIDSCMCCHQCPTGATNTAKTVWMAGYLQQLLANLH